MTRKVYKSAMGKPVDLGALLLQNENVRAVGNMNVNARGDIVDSANRVIENKNKQAQRHYRRQSTNVSNGPVTKGNVHTQARPEDTQQVSDTFEDMPLDDLDADPAPAVIEPETQTRGGLAAAIARSREVKQQLDKTRRQQQQQQGLKKI